MRSDPAWRPGRPDAPLGSTCEPVLRILPCILDDEQICSAFLESLSVRSANALITIDSLLALVLDYWPLLHMAAVRIPSPKSQRMLLAFPRLSPLHLFGLQVPSPCPASRHAHFRHRAETITRFLASSALETQARPR